MFVLQMVSPVVWMKVVVFGRSSMLPHTCSCSILLHGATASSGFSEEVAEL